MAGLQSYYLLPCKTLLLVSRDYHLSDSESIEFGLLIYSVDKEQEILQFLTPEIFVSIDRITYSYQHLRPFLLKKYEIRYTLNTKEITKIELLYTKQDCSHIFASEQELVDLLSMQAQYMLGVTINIYH